MKRITFTAEELKTQAIKLMETVMADISLGNIRMAHINYGCASVYTDMLEELGCYLDEEDEHYSAMLEIYHDQKF